MSDLDPRKQDILRAVILEYVSLAEPVASEAIVQKYGLGVRSATVRNELAEMAELGYLEQPHTSSGRVPSDKGYRYYIDRLVLYQDPGTDVKHRVREATGENDALQNLLRETTKALSRLTLLMSTAATFRDVGITMKSVLLTALSSERALIVMVFSNGHVENRLIEIPPGLTLTDIGVANETLSSGLVGKTLRGLTRLRPATNSESATLDKLLGIAYTTVRNVAKDLTRGQIVIEGEEYMLGQPEMRRNQNAWSELVHALENEEELYGTLTMPGEGPQAVTIGRENRLESLKNFTVIRQRFYVGEDEAGTLALIGPTRLSYDTSIPLLDYAAKAISETLTKMLK